MNKFSKIFLIIWLFLIFYLSKTSGLLVLDPTTWFNGGEYSHKVHITDIFNLNSSFYWGYFEDGKNFEDLSLEFHVRKAFHAIFYAMLTFLFIASFPKKIIFAPVFSLLIASLDEINQFLLIGRSGRLSDIVLDFAASVLITFICFCYIFSKRVFYKKEIKKAS